MNKKVLIFIVVVVLSIFTTLILLNTRNVDRYWNNQLQISLKDSLSISVSEIRYLRGYLSFNKSIYIISAHVSTSNIELWAVTDLNLPFLLNKKTNSDTLIITTDNSLYYFVLDE